MLVLLLLQGEAAAQINHPYNEVGIYAVPDPEGCATAQIDVAPMTPFTCWVVLTAPWNENLGRPVPTVAGIQFRLELPGDVMLLAVDYGACVPPLTPMLPEFWTPCSTPVAAGRATLLGLTLMATTSGPAFVHMSPVRQSSPMLPDQMAFSDADGVWPDNIFAMHPISGSHDVPVFAINWDGDLSFCETVPLRAESFGGLKALYR
ncbi:MAG: hypothetical protein IH621_18600 [Krumholzibacteria bacterium]|nr:hypothetical protein [Candidatus Krumholzibacteria bacterium]